MSSSAPRWRLAIVRTEPPPLVATIRQLYAGRSPLHPPPLQEADVASPTKGAGTESSPHTWRWRFARKGKYNRLGLDGVTRITLLLQGAGSQPAPLP